MKLPIKIIVMNNGAHGMVRQFQQSYFESRFVGTQWGYSAPDFARVAEAYGIQSFTVSHPDECGDALERLWRDPTTPALMDVRIHEDVNVYPKIAYGRPMTEMEPQFKPRLFGEEGT